MSKPQTGETPFIRVESYAGHRADTEPRRLFIGARESENRDFARDEVSFLRRYFADVRRELSPKGRSKLIVGNKHEGAETPG
jgi:hypothetical protein